MYVLYTVRCARCAGEWEGGGCRPRYEVRIACCDRNDRRMIEDRPRCDKTK